MLKIERIPAALGVLVLVAAASCSHAADECELNVTCPEDGATAAGGSTSSSGGGGGETTTTSSASSSSGGPVTCKAGTTEDCAYSGPAGTEGKGVCKGGQRTCQATGVFGACTGEVVPTVEDCVNTVDEDCSGASTCMGDTQGGAGFGDGIVTDDEVVFAVATDKAGNLVLGGVEGSTGNGNLNYTISSGNGAVSKLSPTGQKLWSKTVLTGAGGYAVVRGVATDATGDVIIVGRYKGTIVGPDFSLPTADDVDGFLIKLNAAGGLVFQKAFSGPNGQYPTALAVDLSGNIFLTGTLLGSIDLGGGPKVGMGGGDLFVAKLDKNGNHLWSNAFGNANSQIGYGVATTPEGDIVVAGQLDGAMDFGSGKTVTTSGGNDVFVAKLKGDTGAALWAHNYGDNNDQHANGVAVGSDGSVVLTGAMVGKCNFGGGDLDAKMKSNVFVAKLDANGAHVWSHDYGSDNENQVGLGVTIDPAQNIVVVGYLKGTLAFGLPTMPLIDAASPMSQSTDAFVAKLAADGSALWARSFGDLNDQAAWAVTTDASANVLVGGSFQGTMNLPPSITSTGSYDAFWLKLAP